MAARLIGSGVERVAVNRVVKISDRLRVQALALIQQAAGVIGLRPFRIEAYRLVEVRQRIRQIALAAQQVGAADIGRGVVGVGGDGAGKIILRQIIAAGLAVGQRAIGIGGGVVGVELDRLRKIRNRLAVAPDLGQRDAPCVKRLGAGRVAAHDVVERFKIGAGRLVGVDLFHNARPSARYAADRLATCEGQCCRNGETSRCEPVEPVAHSHECRERQSSAHGKLA